MTFAHLQRHLESHDILLFEPVPLSPKVKKDASGAVVRHVRQFQAIINGRKLTVQVMADNVITMHVGPAADFRGLNDEGKRGQFYDDVFTLILVLMEREKVCEIFPLSERQPVHAK